MRTLDVFLNFRVADMNRNVLWHSADGVDRTQVERMNRYRGDESWRNVAYRPTITLLGVEDEKTDNPTIAQAFRERLQQVAGFSHVPDPIPMRNSRGVIVYYLFFASPKPVAAKIVSDIFDKYRNRRG